MQTAAKEMNESINLDGIYNPHYHGFKFDERVWVVGGKGRRIKARIARAPSVDGNLWWTYQMQPEWWSIPVVIHNSICYIHVDLLRHRNKGGKH